MSPLLAGNVVCWHLLRKWDHIQCCEIFEYAPWSCTLLLFTRRLFFKHLVAMYKLCLCRLTNADLWHIQRGVFLHILVTEGKYFIPWMGDESLKINSSVWFINSTFKHQIYYHLIKFKPQGRVLTILKFITSFSETSESQFPLYDVLEMCTS